MKNIVLVMFALLTVKLQAASAQTGGCEPGWSRSPVGGCFRLFGTDIEGLDRLTWSQARDACQNIGATLATILDEDTQPIITSILVEAPSSHVWIGLSDLDEEGSYKWIDDTPLDPSAFANWGPNQPDNGEHVFEEDCVYLRANQDFPGKWYDGYCDYPRAYICEKPQDPAYPIDTPSVACGHNSTSVPSYYLYNRACFKLYPSTPLSYVNASNFCVENDGTNIASIANAFEGAFVKAMLLNAKIDAAWIGLQTQELFDNLRWSNNWPLEYTNWAPYSPATTKKCVIFTTNGWTDEDCDVKYPVLCKAHMDRLPQRPPFLEGTRCPENFTGDDIFCSAMFTEEVTWDEANRRCQELHSTASLASVHNINEKSIFQPPNESWIGLRASSRGQLEWTDGSLLDYVDFDGVDSIVMNGDCVTAFRDESWNTRNCSETRGFMCRAPLIFDPPDTGGCSEGWYQLGTRCFQSMGLMDVDRRTFAEAQQYCEEQGGGRGNLFLVTSQVAQSLLALLLQDFIGQTNLWIGLSDSESEGVFMWTDGRLLQDSGFTQWAPNQPDGFTEIPTEPFRDCVEVRSDPMHPGMWDDINCLERRGFICETYLNEKLPSNDTSILEMCDSRPGYMRYNDSCYRLINETRTFADAQELCRADGAWVTKARDGFYNSMLTLIINWYLAPTPKSVWISMQQNTQEGDTYDWLVGENEQGKWPFTYANWDTGMPSGDNCTVLQPDSTWSNVPCSEGNDVICEYSATIPEPITIDEVHCPDGWTLIERHCYKFDTLTLEQPQVHFTWSEAQYECNQRYGASLPGIHSLSANNAFQSQAMKYLGDRNVWLGLHQSPDGFYTYQDGRIVNYVNWDSAAKNSDCVGLNTNNGIWGSVHCFAKAGLVCETDPLPGRRPPCPPSWTYTPELFGFCYYVSNAADESSWMSWHEAEQWCNENKGHLTNLDVGAERDYVERMLGDQMEAFWIGLNNIALPGEWIWADGSPYNTLTSDWSPDDERNEYNMQYCVVINENGQWEDLNCGIRRPYVCKWDITQTEPIVVTQPPPVGECPTGAYKLKDRCYDLRFMAKQETWLDAHKECLFNSGELASIHSPSIQALFATFLQNVEGSVWVGMSRFGKYDQYYWSDGSTVDYTNWALGEPNSPYQQQDNENRTNDCVKMVNNANYAGQWNDVDCTEKSGYICEMALDIMQEEQDPPFAPCPSKPGYTAYNNETCYKIIEYATPFTNARIDCQEDEAFLASIWDAYEEAFVEMLLSYLDVEAAWLGLRRDVQFNDKFVWEDGWPVAFTSWMAGYPTGASNLNRCVIMTLDGWRNTPCYNAHQAVCKISTAPKPPPPLPPTGRCSPGWIEDGNQCYFFDTIRKEVSFLEAITFCQSMGPDIFPASSLDTVMNAFLLTTAAGELQVRNLWLGLLYESGEFRWNDGAPYTYTHWAADMPTMPIAGDVCVQMSVEGSGLWKNVDCFVRAGYVCKGPYAVTTTTEKPTPTVRATPPPKPETLSTGAIIGISVGCGAVVVIILTSIVCYLHKKSHMMQKMRRRRGEFIRSGNVTANFANPVYAAYSAAWTEDIAPCLVPIGTQKFISGTAVMNSSDFTDVRLSNGPTTMSTFGPT